MRSESGSQRSSEGRVDVVGVTVVGVGGVGTYNNNTARGPDIDREDGLELGAARGELVQEALKVISGQDR